MGPLEMDAEDPGYRPIERLSHRPDRPHHVVARAGDEGRQKTRGAEGAVGAADRRDGRHCRRIVEHHAGAAVDLEVDEPGRERTA